MNVSNIVNTMKALVPISSGMHGNAPIGALTDYQIHEIRLFVTIVTTFIKINGPITSENSARLYNELLYSKTHQHLLGYLLPNLRVSVAELQKVFPDMDFHTQAQFINTTEALSVVVFQAFKFEFEQVNNLIPRISLLPNAYGNYPKTLSELVSSIQNTGQKNPDALVNFHTKDGALLGKRYFDAKLGDAPGFHGNVMLANNSQELLNKATKLLNNQRNMLGQSKHLFDAHPYLQEVYGILNNKNMAILEKLYMTQSIFKLNIHTLPGNLLPSLLIYRQLPNKQEVLNFEVERDTLKNYPSTENLVAKVIKEKTSQSISKNMIESEGINPSLKARILENTPFFESLPKLPTDLTSLL